MPPDPQSPLEQSPGESVRNTFQAGEHADARCRRTAGGESHFQSPRISGVWGGRRAPRALRVVRSD